MRLLLYLLLFIPFSSAVYAQLSFNEASNKNLSQVTDKNGEYHDWLELYNASTSLINLSGYYLSDTKNNLTQWPFPTNTSVQAGSFLLIYASGEKGFDEAVQPQVNHWETAVMDSDTWRWINPNAATPSDWYTNTFNDAAWNQGQGGFGFADNDDMTTFATTHVAVFTRKKFTISDTSKLLEAVLHVDYDDGFVAYLNGVEIARSNVTGTPQWNTIASNYNEALLYQNLLPQEVELDMSLIKPLLKHGDNVLAVTAHNAAASSSDMSLRVFLSFGLTDAASQFSTTPSWFSKQGVVTSEAPETNFKISSDGETIYLSNGTSILDSIVLPPSMPVNSSYGASSDGASSMAYFTVATPGASNNTSTAYVNGMEPAPVFLYPAGFYTGTINLTMTVPSSTVQIRYTTNGQTPTASSTLYSSPVVINSSQVIKAKCFSTASNKLDGPVTTASYFISETVTNAGILCITTDEENLYGTDGIYDHWDQDWKKPCYIEYFEPTTHQLVVTQNAGIKIDGGAGGSRSNAQKSFRVEPGKGIYGEGDIKYKLIPSINRDSYETFYIRNGSNQYMFYPCKDAIETTCMGDATYNNYSAYTPVNVYLNGQYWGYYELREKQDADYFDQHYDTQNKLELLSLSYWYNLVLRAVEGDSAIEHYEQSYADYLALSTASPTFMDEADAYFDMKYYTDYICAQSWIADTDWPYNNIKIFRSPETGNKWRFGLVDLEWSLEPNGWTNSTYDHINFMEGYNTGYSYIHIWQNAMNNALYKNYFINRFADLMNTAWLPVRLQTIANNIFYETRPELPANYVRWSQGDLYTTDQAHQTMLSELSARSTYVRGHIQSNYKLNKQVSITLQALPAGAGVIKISTITPTTYPWTGIYFDGVPVKIEAIPYAGYSFDYWDNSSFITQADSPSFEKNITQSTTFTAHFKQGGSTNQVVISEINYNSAPGADAEDWVEFWNTSTSLPANLTGWFFTDEDTINKYYFPANTVIPANGRIVVARNSAKFSTYHAAVSHQSAFNFNFSNAGDMIRLFDQNKTIISQVAFQDAAPWPLLADGQGYTLELKSAAGNMNDPANWQTGCKGGSPGTETSAACIPVSMNDHHERQEFYMYPNPATNKLIINASTKLSNQEQLIVEKPIITNMLGQQINYYSLRQAQGDTLLTIDVSQFPAGIYFIKVGDQVQKFIKE